MGVDCRIHLKPYTPMSDLEVRDLAVRLAERFGPPNFFIDRKRNQHCIDRSETFEGFLEVHYVGRFYGRDYERGDCVEILGILRYLEHFGDVFYDPDSCCDDPTVFTEFDAQKLWSHFVQFGRRPYEEGFGKYGASHTCSFCAGVRMINFGGGGGRTYLKCLSCGWRIEKTSEGAIFEP